MNLIDQDLHGFFSQGCNIPDIDIVVQWKLPTTVSSFVQRAGRAARGAGRTGIAVLLVEKTVYDADLSNVPTDEFRSANSGVGSAKIRKSVRQVSTYPKGPKGYANLHGVLRGSYGGASDAAPGSDVPIDWKSLDEGLYNFVQTSICRRAFLTKIYGNDTPSQSHVLSAFTHTHD